MTRFGAEVAALFSCRLATALSRRLKVGVAPRLLLVLSLFGMMAASSAQAQELTPLPDCGCSEGSVERELGLLRQRVAELEYMHLANEDATRTIIRQSFAERQAQINDFVTFGGTLEVLTGWAKDFEGQAESDVILDTVELDFEIQVNSWSLGSIILEYDDGTNVLFPTTEQSDAFVDRFNVDTRVLHDRRHATMPAIRDRRADHRAVWYFDGRSGGRRLDDRGPVDHRSVRDARRRPSGRL